MKNLSKTTKFRNAMILAVLTLITTASYAQLPPGFDSSVEDAELPISGLVALGLVVGGIIGVKKLKK
ncbi:hypothetical protein [Psychroflexus aestuariivivens]|uniref:hypothetical protein n=1 Tax=Psychroflexus aestuariivivens TaxID=1795040 RepID=UPI000FD7C2B1|nr:hypothetical protein [Psychroflexus aestuariivivens]